MAVVSNNTLVGGLNIIEVDHDPTVVATPGDAGSFIVDAAGFWYRKVVSGTNTSVEKIDGGGTFGATIGAGKQFVDIEAANVAFQASGAPQAQFFLFGTVLVGSATVTIPQSVDFLGVDDSPQLDIDQDINSGGFGDTEESRYRFIGLHIRAVSIKRIAQVSANQRYEFLDCNLELTATASIAFWSLDTSDPAQIICRNCVFTDNRASATDGYFFNAGGSVLTVELHACSEAGTPSSFLVRNVTGTLNISFLDGTVIRGLLLNESFPSTANIFQDGSSTFNVANSTGVTTVTVTRMGAASFSGTYTGDGTILQLISGWGFDTRHVFISRRETVDGDTAMVFETTPEIMDDNAAGGAIDMTQAKFNTNAITGLAFGAFTVSDAAGNLDPNASGVVYNFRAEG